MQDLNRDPATSGVLAWTSLHTENAAEDEAASDVDEPPDSPRGISPSDSNFKRSAVLKAAEHPESLLTKALHQSSDETKFQFNTSPTRRRSLNSSISLASTADLTSDTGFTSPARTNTPSPPPPVFSLGKGHGDLFHTKRKITTPVDLTSEPSARLVPAKSSERTNDSAVQTLKQKRCISFACGNPQSKKAAHQQATEEVKAMTEDKSQRKSCIRFAGPSKVVSKSIPPKPQSIASDSIRAETPIKQFKSSSPATSRKHRSPSVSRGRQPRSVTPRPIIGSHADARSCRYLTANAQDLNTESSHFHEFASDEPREEDWIKQNPLSNTRRLTINDTLRKENEIRRLGKEAEEEALEEEEEEEEEQDDADLDAEDEEDGLLNDDDDDDSSGDEDIEDEEDFDGHSAYRSDDEVSDGYNTDNEIGFADSDSDDENLQLWTPSKGLAVRLIGDSPISRRPSLKGDASDSSLSSDGGNASQFVRDKRRRIKIRPRTPELPDSTDFVCGTLDEDRALEDAYISCVAARRREKLHVIPQDIDPSFPTSEPEEEEDIEPVRHGHDSDEQLWIHGELEDLHHTKEHHEADRRKKKCSQASPRRYHSPPPKCRGRSPRRLFDRHSPRRVPSPAPGRMMGSPPASLVQGVNFAPAEFKTLAFRPGLTHTKSLPRAPAIFPQHVKAHRRAGKAMQSKGHVRGAIDIVKGLEQKRQRRTEKFKEKYLQKHNNKARKGQVVHTRPQPGKGAERMREIGLLSAGKAGPDQYVLSV
ncbi:hypothetical protein GGR57DRAFT_446218 [Xylariaceae sp. FL1272]|nr:hypothetical protein GGR57DRAFT_446218 [Xylariaceae sp. FL1272]